MRTLITGLLISLGLGFMADAEVRVFDVPRDAPEQGEIVAAKIISDPSPAKIMASATARMLRNRNTDGTAPGGWWVELTDTVSGRALRGALHWGNENFSRTDERRYLEVSIDSLRADGGWTTLASQRFFNDVELYNDFSSMALELSDDRLDVYVARKVALAAGSASCSLRPNRVAVGADARVKAEGMWMRIIPDHFRKLTTPWTDGEALRTHIAQSADPLEGFWKYLDRDNDPAWLDLGGDYTFATIREPETGDYLIIYQAGARVNPTKWKPGMLKGRLCRTTFPDNFNLIWYDASGNAIAGETLGETSAETSADFIAPSILRLNFPTLRSSFRFTLLPK